MRFQGKAALLAILLWGSFQGRTQDVAHTATPTAVDEKTLRSIAEGLVRVPPTFHVHPTIGRILKSLEIFKAAEPKSWSAGSSEATEQSSVPLTDTWQCSVTRPPTFMREARSG